MRLQTASHGTAFHRAPTSLRARQPHRRDDIRLSPNFRAPALTAAERRRHTESAGTTRLFAAHANPPRVQNVSPPGVAYPLWATQRGGVRTDAIMEEASTAAPAILNASSLATVLRHPGTDDQRRWFRKPTAVDCDRDENGRSWRVHPGHKLTTRSCRRARNGYDRRASPTRVRKDPHRA